MAYRVEVARRAESDFEELYLWVVERAPQQGARWFNGLERAVLSLNQHPKWCPVAPECAVENRDPGIWLLLQGTSGRLIRATEGWKGLSTRMHLPVD